MKRVMGPVALVVMLAAGLLGPTVFAQDEMKTLPTLLIKGEIVSLESDDPSATLMKVKDRYGFETPIFVTGTTQFFQGETEALRDSLQAEVEVEVEYNFDINTAKRYAVVVRLPATGDAPASTLVPTPEPPSPAAEETAEAGAAEEAEPEAGTSTP